MSTSDDEVQAQLELRSVRGRGTPSLRESIEEPNLPPTDSGWQAWTFLATATTMETLIWGMGNAYGTFQEYHERSPDSPLYGSSRASITATGTLIAGGLFFSPWLFNGFLSSYPHLVKRFSLACLALSAVSLVAASFKPTATRAAALQGFLSGWAGGAYYTPCMIWLPQWFVARRSLATGIMFVGSGIGGVVWPFALDALLSRTGFSTTLRILALIQVLVGGLAWTFQKPRLPVVAPDARQRRRRRNVVVGVLPRHATVLHSPLGLVNGAFLFFQGAAYWSVSFYIAPYAASLGLSSTASTGVLSCLNAASAVSFVVIGQLCDAWQFSPLALSLSAVGSALVGLLLGFGQSLAPLLAFAILFGLANGGYPTFLAPAAKEMAALGSSDHSTIFVEYLAWRGAATVTGPLISAGLYQRSSQRAVWGSYGLAPVVIFVTTLLAASAGLAALTLPLRRRVASSHR